MDVTNWATPQREDPVLNTVLSWLEAQKKTNLRTLLGEHAFSEEGQMVWQNHQNFTTLQNTFYLHSMPKEVLKAHRVTALNGCHQDAGHQGCDHTLSLQQECFSDQG